MTRRDHPLVRHALAIDPSGRLLLEQMARLRQLASDVIRWKDEGLSEQQIHERWEFENKKFMRDMRGKHGRR